MAVSTQIAPNATDVKPSDGQIAEAKTQLEVAIRESGVNSRELQRTLERGAEFQRGIRNLLDELGVYRNEFSGEVAQRTLSYPGGFEFPSIEVQCQRLLKLHPDINLEHVPVLVSALGSMPKGADGILIRPKLEYLGRRFGVAEPYTNGYGKLLENGLFPMIAERRKFHNYRAGELTPEHIRLHSQVRVRYEAIEAATPGDVVVSYFSCGINPYKREQDFSPRNFRPTALEAGDLPLGSVDIAGINLLMPDRDTAEDHLHFDCSGDEYNWHGYGFEQYCPYFKFDDGQLWFGFSWSCDAARYFGSPVAFGSVDTGA